MFVMTQFSIPFFVFLVKEDPSCWTIFFAFVSLMLTTPGPSGF